jgi:TM2 domain-containing membrane protein YozV
MLAFFIHYFRHLQLQNACLSLEERCMIMKLKGDLMNENSENPVNHKVDNSIAAVWSMMLPGLGQLMKGQIMPGIIWAFVVGCGYFAFFWPGLIFHTLCILDAAFNKGDNTWIGLDSLPKKITFAALVLGLITYIIMRNF